MKSLRKRIINACIVLAIIALASAGWALSRVDRFQFTLDKQTNTARQRIEHGLAIVYALERLDSAQLLFLLGRADQAVNIFNENSVKFAEALNDMDAIVNDPEGQAVIDSLERNFSQYLQAFLRMQDDAAADGDPGSRYSTEAFPVFSSLSDDSRQLLELSQNRLLALTKESEATFARIRMVLMGIAAFTVLFAFLIGASFVRTIFNPLHQLTKHLRFTRMGRPVEIQDHAGSEELGELTKEFSRISRILQDYERLYKNSQLLSEQKRVREEATTDIAETPSVVLADHAVKDNIRMDIEDVSVLDLVNTAVETLKHQAEAKDIQLVKDIPDNLPEIEADANKVLWVLTNLIGNALRFTHSGGQVVITARAVDNQVYLSVSDTGVGMPKEYQEKVFDKIVQMKGTGEAKGTGIGLTIAREIVQAHHGQIWVESEKEKGATFTFTIPVKPTEL